MRFPFIRDRDGNFSAVVLSLEHGLMWVVEWFGDDLDLPCVVSFQHIEENSIVFRMDYHEMLARYVDWGGELCWIVDSVYNYDQFDFDYWEGSFEDIWEWDLFEDDDVCAEIERGRFRAYVKI